MKTWNVEDMDGGQWTVEAETPKEAARQAAPDAVYVELLYMDPEENFMFALFDADSDHFDDLSVQQVKE